MRFIESGVIKMANENRLIDANAINYRKKDEYCGNGNSRPVRYVFDEDIAELPTVDAVEVVRCRDCKRYSQSGLCNLYINISLEMKPNDFCSYGERREEE